MTVGEELALLAGLDRSWDAVLRVYLAGRLQFPHPFTDKRPTPV